MADFQGVTSSNGAKVSDVDAVRRICEGYWIDPSGALSIENTDDGSSSVGFYGYDWFQVCPIRESSEDDPDKRVDATDFDADASEEMLKAIQPYLMEPLIIQSVGFEKCRYPLGAMQIIVPPGKGKIEFTHFSDLEERWKKLQNLRGRKR